MLSLPAKNEQSERGRLNMSNSQKQYFAGSQAHQHHEQAAQGRYISMLSERLSVLQEAEGNL